MSGTLNIGGDPNDRSYRYKMPRLVAKVEGRGNGIKTRIVNCGEIAQSLHRKPAVLTKFFGCELGAQSRWEEKEEASIVNGAFEANILQEKLCDVFLPKFVLCPNCGLPETDMKVKKEVVKFECAACGYAGNADMGHKLITFILADEKKAKEAKKKDAKKEAKKNKAAGIEEDKSEKKEKSEEKKEKKKDKKEKDKEKSKDKKEKKKEKKEKKKEESDEEEWFTDISLEAVEARRIAEMSSMSMGGAGLVAGDKAPEEAGEKKDEAEEDDEDSSDKSDQELADEMEGVVVSEDLMESFMEKIGDAKKSKEVLPLAAEWAEDLKEDAPNKMKVFATIENLPDHLQKHATIVLKALYDADIVTEEDILSWFKDADQENAAVAAAKKFVDFLEDA